MEVRVREKERETRERKVFPALVTPEKVATARTGLVKKLGTRSFFQESPKGRAAEGLGPCSAAFSG